MSAPDKFDFLKNIEVTVIVVLKMLEDNRADFWGFISKEKPTEPFPKASEHQKQAVIDCCLRVVNSGFYKTDEDKIAHIFYNIIKNHHLDNGNKRLASTIILTIVYLDNKRNGKFISKRDDIKNLSIDIANENGNEKQEEWITKIQKVLFDLKLPHK